MKKDNFNIEFFKYIRDEINKRIDIHYKLVLAKFTFAGALFAFLYSKTPSVGISAFLLSAVFSTLFDIVILENLGWIRSAGFYIRQNIEDTDIKIVKWETDCTQAGGVWSCFSPVGYIAGVWAISPALLIGALIFDYDAANKPQQFMFVVGAYLIAYTLFILFKNLGSRAVFPVTQRQSPIVE